MNSVKKNQQPQNVSLRWGNQRLVRRISELIRRHDRQRLQRLERRALPDGRADVSGDGELLASGAVLRVVRLQRGHGHHLRALLHVRNFLRFFRLQMFQGEKKQKKIVLNHLLENRLIKLGKLGVRLLEGCTKMDVLICRLCDKNIEFFFDLSRFQLKIVKYFWAIDSLFN